MMSSDDLGTNANEPTHSAKTADDRLRVLIVEDHFDTRMSMEILLRRARHYVQSAETAQEALAQAASDNFDVVITDIGLPDMNGIELMKQLRERHGLQGIATSGYSDGEELQAAQSEFLHHLTKPIRMEQLRELLAELRVNKRAQR
jgi:CheY-like chemotaxis protein